MSESKLELVIEGVEAVFEATRCIVEEGIGKPFRATLRGMALLEGAPTGLVDVIGKKATLTLRTHDGERTYVGLVDRVEDRETLSQLTIVSRVGWLADTRDYRVFVRQTAKTIVDTVLGEHGLSVDWLAQRDPPERAQCIQGFESDLDFVTRVLAEEGMCWYPGGERLVCVSDVEGTFVDLALSLPYREEAGLDVDRSVHGARLGESISSTRAVLRDYDFAHPLLDLQGESGDGALEWYEFPGGFVSPGSGSELAAMRLAERRNEQQVLEGVAIALELQAGGVFSLEEAPVEAQNGSWLVIGVTHRMRLAGSEGSLDYTASFRAVPASRGYRPSRPATRPRLGVTTGHVTGASTSELMHDEHGRIRALLRWERRLPADETASTDLRVMQPQLSGGIFNPRVGWEQLLSHSDPRGEIPVTLGRIYNGAQRPPATLPGGKVETHVGTLTTPKGSGGNFTKFDDSAGKEKLLRHASRDFNEKTGKDKKRKVGASEKRKVGGERRASIKKVRNERVDGHQGITIAGLRDVHVTSNFQLTAASENVGILGARLFRIGGDYVTITPKLIRVVGGAKGELCIEHHCITTKGVQALCVGGTFNTRCIVSESIGVAGLHGVKVSNAMNVNCKDFALTVRGIYSENYANRTVTSSASIGENFKSLKFSMAGGSAINGSEIVFQADSRLIIKAKGITITLTDGNIVINGAFDGSVASVEEGNHKYG